MIKIGQFSARASPLDKGFFALRVLPFLPCAMSPPRQVVACSAAAIILFHNSLINHGRRLGAESGSRGGGGGPMLAASANELFLPPSRLQRLVFLAG